MDRVNHVKIITPDPAGVDRFLTEVLEQAHARCVERGIPCTEIRLIPWSDGNGISAF